jgi:hypothetical protein
VSCALRLPKKLFAQKVFGLNLSLKNKKIDFSPQKQWVALSATQNFDSKMSLCCEMEWRYNYARTYSINNS